MTPTTGWKRICCAVDFSEPSRLALAEAIALARSSGAELHLVHVHVRPAPSAVDMLGAGYAEVDSEEHAERELAAWAEDAARTLERPVRSALELGSAPVAIAEYARRAGIDLLVLATHGRTGLPRVLMGSVAERVVRIAPCPVLVTRRRPDALQLEPEERETYRSP